MKNAKFLLLICLFATACTKHDAPTPQGAPAPAQPAAPEAPAPETAPNIPVETVVEKDKCLNLQKLFAKVAALPATSRVREVTTGLRFLDTDDSHASPRAQFVRYLATQTFLFSELAPSEFTANRAQLEQHECDSLVLLSPLGASTKYKLTAAAENEVTIESDSHRETYRMASPHELVITKETTVLDDCNRRADTFPVRISTLIRWDDAAILAGTSEKFEAPFVRKMTEGLLSMPLELGPALKNVNAEGRLELSQAQMQSLLSIDENIDTKRCSDYPWPMPPPTPEPTPTPTPPPTPSPTPEATATPGPSFWPFPAAATPTPAPTPKPEEGADSESVTGGGSATPAPAATPAPRRGFWDWLRGRRRTN